MTPHAPLAATALLARLAPGVRLVERGGAWLVMPRPLRAWRVRPAVLRLLAGCAAGRTVAEAAATAGLRPATALRLLRRLADQGAVSLAAPDPAAPTVSVVIPVRDRRRAIVTCLAALERLDYPRDRLEVIVVDDGSTDGTPDAVTRWAGDLPVRLIRLPSPLGPSAARNRGAAGACGDVLAFTDSDCLPEPGWLRDLTPELDLPGVAGVGGAVLPAGEDGWLQRYEAACSPLSMGRERAVVRPRSAVPYLPSCNLLVRRDLFLAAGGFAPVHPGEDVDLVWRLHAAGHRVHYRPDGAIRHDHRDRLWPFLRRRAAYAGSEAALLLRHPDNGRLLVVPVGLLVGLGGALAAPATRRARLAPLALAAIGADLALGSWRAGRAGVPLTPVEILGAGLRGHGAFLYWAGVNLSRYYALPVLAVSLIAGRRAPGRWLRVAVGLGLLGPAAADWLRLRPRLSLPSFVAAHALDALSYHLGSLAACVRHRTPRPLGLRLVPRWPGGRTSAEASHPRSTGR